MAGGWWALIEGDPAGLVFGVPVVAAATLVLALRPSRATDWQPLGLLRLARVFLAGSIRRALIMSSDPAWVAWPILVPLGGALLCVLVGRRVAAMFARIASLGTAGAAAALAWQVGAQGAVRHAVGGWAPPRD